jgi:hypothetical protein
MKPATIRGDPKSEVSMNAKTILILIAACGIFCVFAWGMFATRRSLLLAGIAFVVALFAGAGGWHAWAETHSVLWTTIYAVVALIAIAAVFRHSLSRG